PACAASDREGLADPDTVTCGPSRRSICAAKWKNGSLSDRRWSKRRKSPIGATRYANGTVTMSLRLIQAAVLLCVAGCSASPSRSAQSTGDRPFTVTEVARFDAPWALDFLPGSGLARTNMALVTETAGKTQLIDCRGRPNTASGGGDGAHEA